MTMIKTTLGVFLLSATATGVLVVPSGAEARWNRTSAQQCVSTNGQEWRNQVGLANYGSGIGATGLYVFCPIRDDSEFPKAEIQGVNIHGHDDLSDDAITARTCVSYWNAWGGECGTYAGSGLSFVGQATISPSTSAWSSSHVGDFGYIFIYLPAGGNSVSGFFTWD